MPIASVAWRIFTDPESKQININIINNFDKASRVVCVSDYKFSVYRFQSRIDKVARALSKGYYECFPN